MVRPIRGKKSRHLGADLSRWRDYPDCHGWFVRGNPNQTLRKVYMSTCTLVQVLYWSAPTQPMPIYVDQTLSGDAVLNLVGGNQVLFVACRLTVVPFNVSHPDASAPDHILRAGWLSLGDSLVLPGSSAEDFWRLPIFVDFQNTFWTPIPTTVGGTPQVVIASLIRVHFAIGVTGRVYVFGL